MTSISVKDTIQEAWLASAEVNSFAVGRISPSKLVKGCKLAIYHDLIGTPPVAEAYDFDRMMLLHAGKFVHEAIQERLTAHYSASGWAYMPEVPTVITDACRGTADAVLYGPEGEIYLHEYKTCSKGVYDGLSRRPLDDHEDQAQLYAFPNRAQGIWIVYISRNDFSIKEFLLPLDLQKYETLVALSIEIEMAAYTKMPPQPKEYFFGNKPCTKSCNHRDVCPLARQTQNRRMV